MSDSKAPLTRHGQWRSTFVFIMATTGAAVGLGNIWKFPHMAGDNGGSAFVIVYLACVLIIGVPTMMAEVMIGKLARKNPVDALSELATKVNKTKTWGMLGWMGALALLSVLSFYSVVAGWSVGYLVLSLKNSFAGMSAEQISGLWDTFLADPKQLLIWHSLFMVMTLVVVARGVDKGIGTASKIMMPFLFFILVALVIYGMTLGHFGDAVHFLFAFDASKLNAQILISALGHAFFTLALGAGALLVYGAYLPEKTSLGRTLGWVALLDTLVAMLAGLAIFPIVFEYQLPAAAGEGLMYKILPIAFAQLPQGQWIGSLFFLLLVFAAWTSTFSLAEPLVMMCIEKFKFSRLKSALYVGLTAWIIGIGALMSFNVWQDVHLIHDYNLFALLTMLPTLVLLPLGGLGFALFAGYVIPKAVQRQTLGLRSEMAYNAWRILIRWFVPVAIGVIFVSNLIGAF